MEKAQGHVSSHSLGISTARNVNIALQMVAKFGPQKDSLELVDVYDVEEAAKLLYEFLSLRPKNVNIRHNKLPPFPRHLAFFRSKPYKSWFLIKACGEYIGATYLTKKDEVGIFLLKRHQGKGRGRRAMKLLLERHPEVGTFVANISPRNPRSMDFFSALGFRHIQNVFELTPRRKADGNG